MNVPAGKGGRGPLIQFAACVAVAFEASTSSRPSPGKVLTPLTLMHSAIPLCPGRHTPGATFSRLTLTLLRDWDPGDIRRLLGEPEMQAPREEFPRGSLQGAGDRFCLNRVTLAEVADPRLNRRLDPLLQAAHALVRGGRGVFLRYGMRKWVAMAPVDTVEEVA